MFWDLGISGCAGNNLESIVSCLVENFIAEHPDANKLLIHCSLIPVCLKTGIATCPLPNICLVNFVVNC